MELIQMKQHELLPPDHELGITKAEVQTLQAPTLMQTIQKAVEKDANIETLAKLWELQKDFERVQAKKDFDAAMQKFKANPPTITHNKTAKIKADFSYSYATHDNVCEVLIPALAAVDIDHHWEYGRENELLTVTCVLSGYGHERRNTMAASPDQTGAKNAIQARASTNHYLERYTLLSACGLSTQGADDDGASSESAFGNPDSDGPQSLDEALDWIANAKDKNELTKIYLPLYQTAQNAKDKQAMQRLLSAKSARLRELGHE
jgi:hypothetical protein